MVDLDRVEASIRKKYHGEIFSRFAKAINAYSLLQEGDKVAVFIEKGEYTQNYILLSLLFKEIQRHRKFEFEIKNILVDSEYESILKELNLEYIWFDDGQDKMEMLRKNGCTKIVLPYTYEDATQEILGNMLKEGCIKALMPRQKTDIKGIDYICPLYLIKDEDIVHWCRYIELGFERPDNSGEMAGLIELLNSRNPYIEGNIFKSVENVNIHTIIRYTENGQTHDFNEWYEDYKRKWGNDRDE